MAEYIERAETAEFFEKSKQTMWHKDDIAATISSKKNIPSADVVEVVHGEWIYNRGQAYGEPLYFCSVCISGGSEWGEDKYCPNCGAKMDGDKNG